MDRPQHVNPPAPVIPACVCVIPTYCPRHSRVCLRHPNVLPPSFSRVSTSFQHTAPVIPAYCLCHSRVLPPSFPHPPTSFQRTASTIPAYCLRHSRTHPRHSREGGNPPASVRHGHPPHATSSTSCIEFDRTELTYCYETMTTQRNHDPRRYPHARNIRTANHVTPCPQPSLVIPAHTHVIPAKAGIQLAVYTIR